MGLAVSFCSRREPWSGLAAAEPQWYLLAVRRKPCFSASQREVSTARDRQGTSFSSMVRSGA